MASRRHGNQSSLLLEAGGNDTPVTMEMKHSFLTKAFVSRFGCISNILQNLQHFAKNTFSMRQEIQKDIPTPVREQNLNNAALRSHQSMCLGLFSAQNTCLGFH